MKNQFNLGARNIAPIILTQEQECKYINIYKHSTNTILKNNALEMLVRSKYKLVLSLANQYAKDKNDFNDIVSDGLKGLLIGINKFDSTKNIKLTTYVYLWILQSIQRNIGSYSLIYAPEESRKLASQISLIKEQYKQQHGGQLPSVEYIAKQLGVEFEKVINAIVSTQHTLSYDTNINSGDNENSFINIVKDDSLTIDKKIIEQEKKSELSTILCNSLNSNEKYVIEHFFGVNICDKLSLKDIAKILCLTVGRIKQIKNKALQKLFNNKQLQNYHYL